MSKCFIIVVLVIMALLILPAMAWNCGPGPINVSINGGRHYLACGDRIYSGDLVSVTGGMTHEQWLDSGLVARLLSTNPANPFTLEPHISGAIGVQFVTSYPGFFGYAWPDNSPRPLTTNVTFSMSETGNFTKKLSGVLITLSNGQSNTTKTDGTCLIGVYPNSSAYTYSAAKTGYYTLFDTLGGTGETGGIKYGTLAPNMGGIPTGFIRTTVFVTDGGTGGTLVGATLNLRDVQNNSWKNGTSIASGTPFDVLTGHTIDVYGSYPGVYTPSSELNAVAGGNYYLPLMPPYPTPAGGLSGGLLNLFVNVRDGNGNASLAHATVTVKLPTGATIVRDSGDWGSAMFAVPNNTVIILSGSKTGYNTISQSFTSEKDLEQMVDLRMYKIWALPTTAVPGPVVTDPITGLPVIDPLTGLPVTAAPVDTRTDAQKDQDLMNLLRDNGEVIMNLAILAIIFGLIKMVMKF